MNETNYATTKRNVQAKYISWTKWIKEIKWNKTIDIELKKYTNISIDSWLESLKRKKNSIECFRSKFDDDDLYIRIVVYTQLMYRTCIIHILNECLVMEYTGFGGIQIAVMKYNMHAHANLQNTCFFFHCPMHSFR